MSGLVVELTHTPIDVTVPTLVSFCDTSVFSHILISSSKNWSMINFLANGSSELTKTRNFRVICGHKNVICYKNIL